MVFSIHISSDICQTYEINLKTNVALVSWGLKTLYLSVFLNWSTHSGTLSLLTQMPLKCFSVFWENLPSLENKCDTTNDRPTVPLKKSLKTLVNYDNGEMECLSIVFTAITHGHTSVWPMMGGSGGWFGLDLVITNRANIRFPFMFDTSNSAACGEHYKVIAKYISTRKINSKTTDKAVSAVEGNQRHPGDGSYLAKLQLGWR